MIPYEQLAAALERRAPAQDATSTTAPGHASAPPPEDQTQASAAAEISADTSTEYEIGELDEVH
jgi:hypothetical protein